ncbi:hypothetical protein TcCL_ESM12674 [Trypanosoma cruzi]|nr:hypothetical protein TcCL_ESM12674 [Trypanosoma cruzi]
MFRPPHAWRHVTFKFSSYSDATNCDPCLSHSAESIKLFLGASYATVMSTSFSFRKRGATTAAAGLVLDSFAKPRPKQNPRHFSYASSRQNANASLKRQKQV